MFVYTNIFGTHIIDEKFSVVHTFKFDSDKEKISNLYQLSKINSCEKEKEVLLTHPGAEKPGMKDINKILAIFSKDAKEFYEENLKLTKKLIKESVSRDQLIIQSVNTIDDLDKNINLLSKRIREWYGMYCPEVEKRFSDNEAFAKIVANKKKEDLEKELQIKSMGGDLKEVDTDTLILFAKQIENLFILRAKQLEYIEAVMDAECPNLKEVAGVSIGARLLAHAGSLKKMATLPASTIQLFGAETALFRHLRTGARPPKHGLIINHPLISKAKKMEKGKVARGLSDKIAIAVKIDYFKGEFIGKKLREDLEKKFA